MLSSSTRQNGFERYLNDPIRIIITCIIAHIMNHFHRVKINHLLTSVYSKESILIDFMTSYKFSYYRDTININNYINLRIA